MPSALASLPSFDAETRAQLLQRFTNLPSRRERPGRFWRIDLDAIEAEPGEALPYTPAAITSPSIRGGFALDLRTASERHGELLNRAFAAVDTNQKFSALAAALCNTGALIYVPAGVDVTEPIEIAYDVSGGSLYPITLVLAEAGARCTVIERVTGAAQAMVCGITGILCGEGSSVSFACDQQAGDGARAIFTRDVRLPKDSSLELHVAHLGAQLAVDALNVHLAEAGASATIGALFFPTGTQHVDVTTSVFHDGGGSQSQTMVKSAAAGAGQARYLGTIRIARHAQSTEASLRDDALLLSKKAHIDSVPALEIAANDVKAYHGATVGALDEDSIFYMTSRGLERSEAERMIALGFFEPVVDRFPAILRDGLRAQLERKVAQ